MGAYIINYDEYKSIGTHWIALYLHENSATSFDCFGVEYISKKKQKKTKKTHRHQKYHNYRLWNTSIQFNNAFVLNLFILC